jgi:hypothetical protein
LTDRHLREHIVDEGGGMFGHAAAATAWTEARPLREKGSQTETLAAQEPDATANLNGAAWPGLTAARARRPGSTASRFVGVADRR